MNITDLLSREEWAEVELEFNRVTGMDTNVYDDRGFTFTGLKQWANEICPRIKEIPAALQAVCSVAHQNLAQIARQTGKPVVEECDIGLTKICVPVIVNDRFVGAFGGCGYLLEDSEVDTFLIHKLTGMQESEAEKLTASLPRITRNRAEAVALEMEDRIRSIVDAYSG